MNAARTIMVSRATWLAMKVKAILKF